MAVPIQSQITNPITGVFGNGQMQVFSSSGTWNVPPGVAKVRVRLWGAGANYCGQSSYYSGGGGGGFALKTIYELTGISSIPVTVGAGNNYIASGVTTSGFQAGTSSFGSYCSATGGITGSNVNNNNNGGIGIGGDINYAGGKAGYGSGSSYGAGGGCGSLIGTGGNGSSTTPGGSSNGGGGGGMGYSSGTGYSAGGGFMTSGGIAYAASSVLPNASIQPFSIDFIGTGGGGAINQAGVNGGGGGYSGAGGFPGGGSGYGASTDGLSAGGLVIVEW